MKQPSRLFGRSLQLWTRDVRLAPRVRRKQLSIVHLSQTGRRGEKKNLLSGHELSEHFRSHCHCCSFFDRTIEIFLSVPSLFSSHLLTEKVLEKRLDYGSNFPRWQLYKQNQEDWWFEENGYELKYGSGIMIGLKRQNASCIKRLHWIIKNDTNWMMRQSINWRVRQSDECTDDTEY